MTFEDMTQLLDKRIRAYKNKVKAAQQRFQELRLLMDEDIELIKKCHEANIKFPTHKEAVDVGGGRKLYPLKFHSSMNLGKFGLAKENQKTVEALAFYICVEDAPHRLIYNKNQTKLLISKQPRALPRLVDIKAVDAAEVEIYETFCDEFEKMHKEFREWLEKELAAS